VNGRELFDRHFVGHRDEWNRLTVAMDTLGDSAEALEHFEREGFGSALGKRYLLFYGTLQALILQQESIRTLYTIFCGKPLDTATSSGWKRIREIRNLSAGHPLDKRGSKTTGDLRVFVSRPTISEKGFDLIICEEQTSQTRIESVDLESPYHSYKEEALGHLADVEAAQRRRWPE